MHSLWHLLVSSYAVLDMHVVRRIRAYSALLAVSLVLALTVLFVAPLSFPAPALVVVPEGASVGEVTHLLEERHMLLVPVVLKTLFKVTGTDQDVWAGNYLFVHPIGAFELWYRLANGISGVAVVPVTFPEGFTAAHMAERLSEKLVGFDTESFLARAQPLEGYLFPDTYLFEQTATVEEVIDRMHATFTKKIETVDIDAFGRPLHDVVTMASLLEREGSSLEDRRMIAGILWKRVDEHMALQVDAVFGYIYGKDTFHPSLADLEVDSPYNTYKYPGLPPGPIANPGLESLQAAVTPIESEYWYYLSDKEGVMHYARTFEEHKENRVKYLSQ